MIAAALVGFAWSVRHAGVAATPDRVRAMAAAVDAAGSADPVAWYWAGRLTLCAGPDDLPVYDAAFRAYFGGLPAGADQPPPARMAGPRRTAVAVPAGSGQARPDPGDGAGRPRPAWAGPPPEADHSNAQPGALAATASDTELLRHRDVALLTPAERTEVNRLVALLAPAPAPRATRRRRPARRGELDPRRTVRHALRQHGEPVRLARRHRREVPRRLVLLLDVSGSMAPYADALLRFGHAAVRRRPTGTEVFTVGTRLTRISRALRHRDPDAALAAAAATVPDWHGGTRLADGLRAFLDRWGRRGTARGAVVVLFSDGWERGDPAALATQVQRCARLAYRLIWVNPHRGKPGYAPLAGGMAAALPHLDEFVAGHSLVALAELARLIARA